MNPGIRILALACVVSALAHAGEATPRKGWQAAQTTSKGNAIAGWLEYEKGKSQGPERPIEVESPYAFLLLDCQWHEAKGYYVFDNITKSYFATIDFQRFLEELSRLPDKSDLEEIATCTVNCRNNLSEVQIAELDKTCVKKQFKLKELLNRVCYCESSGLHWLDVPGKGPVKW